MKVKTLSLILLITNILLVTWCIELKINNNRILNGSKKLKENIIILNDEQELLKRLIIWNQQSTFNAHISPRKDKDLLIVYLPKFVCSSCAEEAIRLLIDKIKTIGADNIIILTSTSNEREAIVFKNKYFIEGVEYINISNKDFVQQIYKSNRPAFFILQRNSEISNFFVYEKRFKDIADKYFNWIIHRYY